MVVGECPVCKAARARQANLVAPAQPAHAEALHPLRELRGVPDGLPAAAVRRHHAHRERCASTAARPWWSSRRAARGPWKLCPNFDCPGKEQDEEKKGASGAKGGAKKAPAKKAPAKKARGEEGSPRRSRPPRRFPPTKPSGRFPIDRLVGPDRPRQRSTRGCAVPYLRIDRSAGRTASGSCRTLFTSFLRRKAGFPTREAGQAISVDRFPCIAFPCGEVSSAGVQKSGEKCAAHSRSPTVTNWRRAVSLEMRASSVAAWQRGALQCGAQNLTSKESNHMPKVTIVGAGNVGATAAHIVAFQEPGRRRAHRRGRGPAPGQGARHDAHAQRGEVHGARWPARTTTPTRATPTWWSSPPASPASPA